MARRSEIRIGVGSTRSTVCAWIRTRIGRTSTAGVTRISGAAASIRARIGTLIGWASARIGSSCSSWIRAWIRASIRARISRTRTGVWIRTGITAAGPGSALGCAGCAIVLRLAWRGVMRSGIMRGGIVRRRRVAMLPPCPCRQTQCRHCRNPDTNPGRAAHCARIGDDLHFLTPSCPSTKSSTKLPPVVKPG